MIDQTYTLMIQKLGPSIIPYVVFLVGFIVAYIVRGVLLIRLAALAKNTKTNIDDIIISAVRYPSVIWCLMIAIYCALIASNIPRDIVTLLSKALLILGIISVVLVLNNIVKDVIRAYSTKAGSSIPATSFTQNIARIVIFGIGILIILNALGISITPILATLGVGGLAVALALQDTLSNLFAGFYTIVSKQVRVGDYIKLESGEEGYVTDINWRITKIKMLQNNTVLVPNAKLTQSIIVNYYMPETEMAVLVNLGVHYNSDLEKVEKVTCEVAKEVLNSVAGGIGTFDPFIRYNTFADSSINFTVILRGKEFVDQYLIKHEFIKRLHARYNKEGIVIPFPIRAVNYDQEKAGGGEKRS